MRRIYDALRTIGASVIFIATFALASFALELALRWLHAASLSGWWYQNVGRYLLALLLGWAGTFAAHIAVSSLFLLHRKAVKTALLIFILLQVWLLAWVAWQLVTGSGLAKDPWATIFISIGALSVAAPEWRQVRRDLGRRPS